MECMHTDVSYYDVAVNVQKDPLILFALFPKYDVFDGREHVSSPFFSDIAKIAPIKIRIFDFIFFVFFFMIILYCLTLKLFHLLIVKVCRIYNVFGSVPERGIYVQFIQKLGVHNNGMRAGLLRVAGNRFATDFYSIVSLVLLQDPLLATIHQAIFSDINFNDRVRSAVMDIENKTFCKSLYTLLRSVYLAIRALRCCDSNMPSMDKIYYLSKRTTLAIESSFEMLNDYDLFGPVEGNSHGLGFEPTVVFGLEVNNASPANTISSSNSSDDDITNEDKPMTLGYQIIFQW